VVLAISAASLLRGRVVVHELRIADLRIEQSGGDRAPPALPQSLRAPRAFLVEKLRVDRLAWGQGDEAVEARNIELGLDYDGGRYALALRSAETPWLALNGNVRLGDAAPFPLAGRMSLVPRDQRVGPIALAIAGELPALGVGALGSVYGAPIALEVALLPFHPGTLALIELGLEGLDARAIAPEAPRARLDVALEANLDREAQARGRLRVINRMPGLPTADRLPVESLQAQFEGGGRLWRFDDILLQAGSAGALSGRAELGAHGLTADLQAHALNLQALHPRLYATALAGPLHVKSDGEAVAMQASLTGSGARLAADAMLARGQLEVRQAGWRGVAGEVEVRGITQTTKPYAFEASGRVRQLDPSRLGDYPGATLNGAFEAKGGLEPMAVELALDVADSRFRGQPLAASARAKITPQRITGVDVQARLAAARASVQGQLGAAGDVLKWNIDVPDLRVAHAAAAGRLKATGAVYGDWREPAFDVEVDAAAVRWGEQMRVARLTGKGRLAEGLTGRVDMAAEVESLRAGGINLDRARAAVEGSRDRHRARLEAAGGGYRVEAALAGALDTAMVWQGTVESLQVRGPLSGGIEQPVAVMLSASAARAGPARLRIGPGTIDLAAFAWQAPSRIATRGSMSGVALASLQPLVPIPEPLRQLVIGARWDIDAAESVNGSLQLVRESGDLMLPGGPELAAGLRAVSIEARAQSSAIVVDAHIDSAAFGTAALHAATRASMRNGFWGIAGDAPLDASVSAKMPSLAWTRALTQDAVNIEGDARLDVRVSGSVGTPVYDGELAAGNLRVGVPELGLALQEGSLAARLQGQQLSVTALRFVAGSGEIKGSGAVRLVPGDIQARLELDATRVTVLSRPDRLVVVSGKSAVRWDGKQLRAEGKLVADRGLIELPPEDTPRPSSDVVVVGRTAPVERGAGIYADVLFDLGKDFRLQGRGIATRLAGTLRVQLDPKGAPVVTGTVRALDGIYSAYGQKLTIQRGTLTFAGPAGNPALDILAVRKTDAVEVGVAIGGTALLPQVRLVSTPPMTDAERLAWLTLGRGLDQVGGNEAAVLRPQRWRCSRAPDRNARSPTASAWTSCRSRKPRRPASRS
jgi:translocation and assembly module TamB